MTKKRKLSPIFTINDPVLCPQYLWISCDFKKTDYFPKEHQPTEMFEVATSYVFLRHGPIS